MQTKETPMESSLPSDQKKDSLPSNGIASASKYDISSMIAIILVSVVILGAVYYYVMDESDEESESDAVDMKETGQISPLCQEGDEVY